MGEKTYIMVNNVPRSFTNDEFIELFTKLGPIKSGKLVKYRKTSKNPAFGFIDFQHPDDAKWAIESMNGYSLQNEKLIVKLARIDDPKKRNLFVSQIPSSYVEEDLESLFSIHGNVLETKILKDKKTGVSKGVGFVVYEWQEDAANAIESLNKKSLPGEKTYLSVKYAAEDEKQGKRPEKHQPLFVNPMQNMGMQGAGMSCMSEQSMHRKCCPAHMSAQFQQPTCIDFYNECAGRNFPAMGEFDCQMRDFDCTPKRDFDCSMRDYNDYPVRDMDYSMKYNQSMRGYGQMSDMDYNSAGNFGAGFNQVGQFDMHPMRQKSSNFDFNQSRMQGNFDMSQGIQDFMNTGYGDQQQHNNLTLYVYNIGTDATDTTLWSMFAPLGKVEKVSVVYDQQQKCKGYGFVTMKEMSEALIAIEKLNGTLVKGKKLQVSFHHKKSRHH